MSFTLGYFNRLKRKKETCSTNAAKKKKEVEVILIGRCFSRRIERSAPMMSKGHKGTRERGLL